MARKDQPSQVPADRPEFPKPLVRLKAEAGGYGCEVRMVGDSDAEGAAGEEGFQPLTIPEAPLGFQEYPKWLYHEDGRRQIVQSQVEADALEGFVPIPPPPPGTVPTEGVPPSVAAALAGGGARRPPVPADRG